MPDTVTSQARPSWRFTYAFSFTDEVLAGYIYIYIYIYIYSNANNFDNQDPSSVSTDNVRVN